jgi:hypothetical protein
MLFGRGVNVLYIVIAVICEFAGSNPAEDSGFLRAIKIHSMTSFGAEIRSSVPCKVLRNVKEPY